MDTQSVVARIDRKHPGSILKFIKDANEIVAAAGSFPQLMKAVHEENFDMLVDIVGIDWTPRIPRFDLVYLLLSTADFTRLRVRLQTEEGQEVPTVSDIWHSANWGEREVYDLLGISFSGHPDLRRILTWKNFDGHPLRKDFPLQGKHFDKPFNPETIEDY